LLLGGFALTAKQEQSNESMNSSSGESRRIQEAFRRDFGSDEVVVVSLTHPDLLGSAGLELLAGLTQRIGALDGVGRATSLTNTRQIVAGPYGAEEVPLIPPEAAPAETAPSLRAALDRNPHLEGLLISRDRRTAGIAVEVDDRPGNDSYRAHLVESLREIQRQPLPPGVELHVTGITLQKHDTMRLVRRDQAVLLPLSILMLAAALAFSTRSAAGVAAPLLVTGITVVWTVGLYTALGFQVNVITALLPPLGLVLSIANSLHLFKEWVALAGVITDRIELLRESLSGFLFPAFMTSLTTAVGLGSLATSEIPAVRLFGLFGAFSILLSFVLNVTLLPALLSYMRPPPPRTGHLGTATENALARGARLAVRRPVLVLLLAALPTAVAVAGIPKIRNNTDLVRFLKPGEPLVRDTQFIDQTLGCANSIDFVVERRDGKPLTGLVDVQRVEALAGGMRTVPNVTGTLALTDLLAQLQRAETGTNALALPGEQADLTALFDLLEQAEDPVDVRRLATPDFRRTRVNVRLRAIGTDEAGRVLQAIDAVAARTLGSDYALTPAGGFYHVTVDSNRLVRSQVSSFGTALALVLLIVGVTLRSLKLLLAAILPNVVPIVWTAGIMGWLGIDLSSATTMVASVVLGSSVDDAIHYLARFRRKHRGDLEATVTDTTLTTGRVLVSTTVVLTLGFWIGAFSSFKPTVYFSVLTGVSLMTALLCTLLLLPACLRLLHAEPRART